MLVEGHAALSGQLRRLQATVKFKAEAEFKVRILGTLLRAYHATPELPELHSEAYHVTPPPSFLPKLPTHASLAAAIRAHTLLKGAWGQWRHLLRAVLLAREQKHQTLTSFFFRWTSMVHRARGIRRLLPAVQVLACQRRYFRDWRDQARARARWELLMLRMQSCSSKLMVAEGWRRWRGAYPFTKPTKKSTKGKKAKLGTSKMPPGKHSTGKTSSKSTRAAARSTRGRVLGESASANRGNQGSKGAARGKAVRAVRAVRAG